MPRTPESQTVVFEALVQQLREKADVRKVQGLIDQILELDTEKTEEDTDYSTWQQADFSEPDISAEVRFSRFVSRTSTEQKTYKISGKLTNRDGILVDGELAEIQNDKLRIGNQNISSADNRFRGIKTLVAIQYDKTLKAADPGRVQRYP